RLLRAVRTVDSDDDALLRPHRPPPACAPGWRPPCRMPVPPGHSTHSTRTVAALGPWPGRAAAGGLNPDAFTHHREVEMEHLSPLDAAFLDLEDRHCALHIGGVAIFEGPAPTAAEMATVYERSIALEPRYRRRLRRSRFGLTRPA